MYRDVLCLYHHIMMSIWKCCGDWINSVAEMKVFTIKLILKREYASYLRMRLLFSDSLNINS